MKFIHTSDLHLGKTVNDFSMLEEQRHSLSQIRAIAAGEHADAVVIAGDIYDRSIPSTEAVELLDGFLTELLQDNIAVIMVSGNHDSAERVAFADRILEKQGLYISGGYGGSLRRVEFADALGKVTFLCMPFIKPSAAGGRDSAEAVQEMLRDWQDTANADQRRPGDRYVLVTHFFVTGEQGEAPELSDSETSVHVGGLDNVPASLFGGFDYVALGHIHKPQRIGGGEVHYAGSPLKYSFSEVKQEKGVNVVDWDEKGNIRISRRTLSPIHEMRIIRGELAKLMDPEVAALADREDYIQAQLTDKIELIDPIGTLRSVYPNVMQIVLERNSKGREQGYEPCLDVQKKSIEELFGEFYAMLKEEPLDDKRLEIVRQAAEEFA